MDSKKPRASPLFRQGRSSTDSSGRKCVDKYILGHTLGQGSMGKVKLATTASAEHMQHLAVKIIPRIYSYSPSSSTMTPLSAEEQAATESRVLREASALFLLNHPSIVNFHDAIISPSNFYLFFEYVDGGQLLDYIVLNGKLNESVARRMIQSLVSAIDYCHEHFIVHRDLKIENILLTKDLDIKLIDFGLSNIFHRNSLLHTFCGSLYFASPELLSARPYRGPEVDCWSLGVILYVLTCGKVPFDSPSMAILHAKIKRGDVHYPSHLSPPLHRLLSRILVVDPTKRATLNEIKNHIWTTGDVTTDTTNYHSQVPSYIPTRKPLTLPLDSYIINYMQGLRFGSTTDDISDKLHCIVYLWNQDLEKIAARIKDTKLNTNLSHAGDTLPMKRNSALIAYSMVTDDGVDAPHNYRSYNSYPINIKSNSGNNTKDINHDITRSIPINNNNAENNNSTENSFTTGFNSTYNSHLSTTQDTSTIAKRWGKELKAPVSGRISLPIQELQENEQTELPVASWLPDPLVAIYYLARERLEREGYVSPVVTTSQSLALKNKNDSGTDVDERMMELVSNNAELLRNNIISTPHLTVIKHLHTDRLPFTRQPHQLPAQSTITHISRTSNIAEAAEEPFGYNHEIEGDIPFVDKQSSIGIDVDLDLDAHASLSPTSSSSTKAHHTVSPLRIDDLFISPNQTSYQQTSLVTDTPTPSAIQSTSRKQQLSPLRASLLDKSPSFSQQQSIRSVQIAALPSQIIRNKANQDLRRQASMQLSYRRRDLSTMTQVPGTVTSTTSDIPITQSPNAAMCNSPATIHVRLDDGTDGGNIAGSFASQFDMRLYHNDEKTFSSNRINTTDNIVEIAENMKIAPSSSPQVSQKDQRQQQQRSKLGQSHKNISLFGRHWKQSSIANFFRRSFVGSSKTKLDPTTTTTTTVSPSSDESPLSPTIGMTHGDAVGATPISSPKVPKNLLDFIDRLPTSIDKLNTRVHQQTNSRNSVIPPSSPSHVSRSQSTPVMSSTTPRNMGSSNLIPVHSVGLSVPRRLPMFTSCPSSLQQCYTAPKTRYNPFAVTVTAMTKSYEKVQKEVARIIHVQDISLLPPSPVTRVVYKPIASTADVTTEAQTEQEVVVDIYIRKFPVIGYGVDLKCIEGDKKQYKALVDDFVRAWAL